ncbi:MAG TPA: serine protease [Vicinamibacterales bacterium]|nr:serine protease [Vicinamibacterales bacterium]
MRDSRRTLVLGCLLATVATVSGVAVGALHARRASAATLSTATTAPSTADAANAKIVAEVRAQIEREMGLVPLSVMRERRASFVELYAYDSLGKTHYGTAGYLGHGYLITVKHAVVGLKGDTGAPAPAIDAVKVVYKGNEIPATVVDTGDATVEVHKGDWAIIHTRDLDLPPLRVDTAFAFDFAEPIFRLGNDYSRGIMVSNGYVGQRLPNGLVSCLIDGHPGVSGGGVLDRRGRLVGIPIGRLEDDYRFSFLLPLRPEMLRKVRLDADAD